MDRARRIVGVAAIVVAAGAAASAAGAPRGPAAPTADPRAVQLAARCFAMPESKVVGVDRICYYRCGALTITTITVPATDLCPMFIDR